VLNRRRQIVSLRSSGSWMRSQTGRVMSGLILGAIAPRVADAARKGEHRADKQDPKSDDAGNNRDTTEETNQSDTASDERNQGKASAESHDDGAKSDNSGKHVRNESASGNDGGREQRATDSGKTRDNSGHNADSDSDSHDSSTDHSDSHHHGGRHVLGFEQKAGNSTGDSTPDSSSPNTMPDATAATPANPNVAIDHLPDTSLNDLVVQGNDNVLASVSTSGGFAFARSGDVIAVSGPDGASIIQSGNVNTGTSGTTPAEPSDGGGNNDVGFAS
jgi:hypothetical protein